MNGAKLCHIMISIFMSDWRKILKGKFFTFSFLLIFSKTLHIHNTVEKCVCISEKLFYFYCYSCFSIHVWKFSHILDTHIPINEKKKTIIRKKRKFCIEEWSQIVTYTLVIKKKQENVFVAYDFPLIFHERGSVREHVHIFLFS